MIKILSARSLGLHTRAPAWLVLITVGAAAGCTGEAGADAGHGGAGSSSASITSAPSASGSATSSASASTGSGPGCTDSGEALCDSGTPSCTERFTIGGHTVELYRNQSLTHTHCAIQHAVIVVHGRDRDADAYFEHIAGAATTAGRLSDTLIISPYFREAGDPRDSTDLYWDRNLGSAALYDWAMGGESSPPAQVSSYAFMDALVQSIATSGYFPNLTSVVLAGHSAGAQLVQRYAAGGNAGSQSLSQAFSYVAANPSSYVYLNAQRPVGASLTSFAVPQASGCPYYNEYGYGLDDLNPYMNALGPAKIIDQYIARKVTYLLGSSDTGADGLDVTCYANLQGKNRFERGTAYSNHIDQFFPQNQHDRLVVPNVAHSGSGMFNSSEGISVLFPG